MLDSQIVGYWSDEELYFDSMEVAEIVLRPEGSGWTYRAHFRTFALHRFDWHTTADHSLVLCCRECLSGTWVRQETEFKHQVAEQRLDDEERVLHYQVSEGHNVFGKPATLLQFSKPVITGAIGDRFAYKREVAEGEADPVEAAATRR
ncbi:MAG TPA: hypothetical protein VF070_27250 [Streptosporangiaceae bacterium]